MSTATKRLLDRTFKYVKANDTDVAKTFARIRRQQKEAEKAAEKLPHIPIKRRA